jgi:hypothetical protein
MFKFVQFDSDEVRGFRGLPYSRFKEHRRLADQASDHVSAVRNLRKGVAGLLRDPIEAKREVSAHPVA